MKTIKVTADAEVCDTVEVEVDVSFEDIKQALSDEDIIELFDGLGGMDFADGIIEAVGRQVWSPSDYELLRRAVDNAVVMGRRCSA